MFIVLIIGVALYYIFLFWSFRKKGKNKSEQPILKKENTTEVIGKSNYSLGQAKTAMDYESQFCNPTDNDSTFVPDDQNIEANLLDIEFKIEYEDELTQAEIEDEEIACYMGEETQPAQGISFEEMAQAAQVLEQETPDEHQGRRALQTFSNMEQSGLFDTMIELLDNGRAKVAHLLSRYETALPIQSDKDEISNFDINNYM